MSKQWYFQAMGTEVGPVTSAELKEKVKLGQIQRDTRVRLGTAGKWHPADRVKGLLDLPSASQETTTGRVDGVETPGAASATTATGKTKADVTVERTYHLIGTEDSAAEDSDEPESGEYDFFRFIGFEQALGPVLHQVLVQHARREHLTITQITRRAIAEFLGRKDLAGDQTVISKAATEQTPPPATETPTQASAMTAASATS